MEKIFLKQTILRTKQIIVITSPMVFIPDGAKKTLILKFTVYIPISLIRSMLLDLSYTITKVCTK